MARTSEGFHKSAASPPMMSRTSPGFHSSRSADYEQRIQRTKHFLGTASSPSMSSSSGFKQGSTRRSKGSHFVDVDEEEQADMDHKQLKEMLKRKAIDFECDAAEIRTHLGRQSDHDLRRVLGRLLEHGGVHPSQLHGVKKVGVKVRDTSEAQSQADAAKLFACLQKTLGEGIAGMSDYELLPATLLLAEASLQAQKPKQAPATRAICRDTGTLRDEVHRQADIFWKENETARAKQRVIDAAFVPDISRPPPPPIFGPGKRLVNLVDTWDSEEKRAKDQFARGQQRIKDLLTEKEDRTAYMQRVLDQQLDILKKEKELAWKRMLRLPCAMVRVTLGPKLVKSRKTLDIAPPPDEETLKKTIASLVGAARAYHVKPHHVVGMNKEKAINVFDFEIHENVTVTGLYETVKTAVFDKMDYDGVRGCLETYCNLDSMVVTRKWPWKRVQAELEARFGFCLDFELLRKLAGPIDEVHQDNLALWEAALKEEGETQELEDLLSLDTELADATTVRQGARSLEELYADAGAAQMALKKRLVTSLGGCWAEIDHATADAGSRTWQSPPLPDEDEEGAAVYEMLVDGRHYDPGLKPKAVLLEKVAACGRHDDDEAFRDVVDVSRLSVGFNEISRLYAAAMKVKEVFENDIVWFDNKVKNPSMLGFREVNVGIRQLVSVDPSGEQLPRVHITELRLTLNLLADARATQWQRALTALGQVLSGDARIGSQQLRRVVARAAMQAMEMTSGRAQSLGQHQFHYEPRIMNMPHQERTDTAVAASRAVYKAKLLEKVTPLRRQACMKLLAAARHRISDNRTALQEAMARRNSVREAEGLRLKVEEELRLRRQEEEAKAMRKLKARGGSKQPA
eukprot:TRINITY_DN12327_c0_g1_i1.p1 TRINITY_DN12327_c0_g1~~TRINITY_DN12327_c0_g1_i1.p1  ORF type:complete len:903 (+),score=207.94 TRINITY_DN12327_c0_g1_i1:141-2711(+)